MNFSFHMFPKFPVYSRRKKCCYSIIGLKKFEHVDISHFTNDQTKFDLESATDFPNVHNCSLQVYGSARSCTS